MTAVFKFTSTESGGRGADCLLSRFSFFAGSFSPSEQWMTVDHADDHAASCNLCRANSVELPEHTFARTSIFRVTSQIVAILHPIIIDC